MRSSVTPCALIPREDSTWRAGWFGLRTKPGPAPERRVPAIVGIPKTACLALLLSSRTMAIKLLSTTASIFVNPAVLGPSRRRDSGRFGSHAVKILNDMSPVDHFAPAALTRERASGQSREEARLSHSIEDETKISLCTVMVGTCSPILSFLSVGRRANQYISTCSGSPRGS